MSMAEEENTVDTSDDTEDPSTEEGVMDTQPEVESIDKYQEDLADVLGYAKQISGRLEVLVPSLLDSVMFTKVSPMVLSLIHI